MTGERTPSPPLTIDGTEHILRWLSRPLDYGFQEATGYGFNPTPAAGAAETQRR